MPRKNGTGAEAPLNSWAKELRARVDRFNQANPIGSPVRVSPENQRRGRPFETKTRTEAFLFEGQWPSVYVEGQGTRVPLTRVHPTDPKAAP